MIGCASSYKFWLHLLAGPRRSHTTPDAIFYCISELSNGWRSHTCYMPCAIPFVPRSGLCHCSLEDGLNTDIKMSAERTSSGNEASSSHRGNDGYERLGPAVRLLMHQHHLTSNDIRGTGPFGNVVKGDVLEAIEKGVKPSQKAADSSKPADKPQDTAKKTEDSDQVKHAYCLRIGVSWFLDTISLVIWSRATCHGYCW